MMERFDQLQVGVLALQGDYGLHLRQLQGLGAPGRLVRLPADLEGLDALILPGGESTTMEVLIDRFGLRQPLTAFARTRPIYGTCAGMILLAGGIEDNRAGIKPLGLIDIDVVRNGYGRQVFSFEETLSMALSDGPEPVRAAFIRAPKVTRTGPSVQTLSVYRDSPVLVRSSNILAASFHAELDGSANLLRYFLTKFLSDTGRPDV
ncbi:MAG TPA: pyridoxal 5'-phosphate synthase glutaminase subunit PdxT [Acidobacteriota bacterium]|nr:pyridoxal 5'-phosphate synthase glutaminase subunit PdxT [Acidobacteriota bacterium]